MFDNPKFGRSGEGQSDLNLGRTQRRNAQAMVTFTPIERPLPALGGGSALTRHCACRAVRRQRSTFRWEHKDPSLGAQAAGSPAGQPGWGARPACNERPWREQLSDSFIPFARP
jgi:hypothetical protein